MIRSAAEWRTVALAAIIYGGWIAATWWHAVLPIWLLVPIGAWIVAWHGSLQHETIHGHPTRSAGLNAALGGVPLSLWLPYGIYRRTHLAHHATPNVTDPLHDPESRYLASSSGLIGALRHRVERVQATLAGRLLLGPPISVATFLLAEARRAVRAPRAAAADWIPHLLASAVLLSWLNWVDFDWGRYLLAFVYPGTALTLLRSFAEHRAAPAPGERIAIVERAGALGLLFLNNNLHAAHHHMPALAWYALPAYHARHRAALLTANGGLLYRGYGEIVRRYLFRPHDDVLHPDHGKGAPA